ncbi:glycosyltransferase family 4 protein [Tenacibaculum agarivorans]|uniref:glycosyltransferase family 4 protein n=1 Tax=Tenacibaculum agarivorans TaxID=1908389 RepID=UPI00094BA18A|nr:glycosyltransferase family 4 protein [Tenacibaculum agarivorans]
MNILISAHEFSPVQGSECAEGWNIVSRLAKNKNLNITVLYARGSQYAPESYFKAVEEYYAVNEKESNLTLVPVDQPKTTLLLAKFNRFITMGKGSIGFPVLYYLGYAFWQKKAYQISKSIIQEQQIDLVHNLTQITYREPGFLWKTKTPFVWGPTGGIEGISFALLKSLSLKQKVFELIRNTSNYLQFKFKRRIKKAIKKAKLIYAFSENDRITMGKYNTNVKILLDSGTNPVENPVIRQFNTGKLNIIWVGQLIERKGLIMLIKALENIKDVNNKLNVNILGDGPLKELYKTEVENRELDCVNFLGRIPHKEVQSVLASSHVLMHTSYREATTHVVPESLSTGLPVICHDAFGLSIAVTSECGIKIPLKSFDDSIKGFSSSIEYLLENPSKVKQMSIGAIERSKELSWDLMIEQIVKDYETIINK